MSWVTVIWSMVASACLTLAAMHLVVWYRKRAAWANLLFSLSAVGTAGLAGCELWMMRAETPAEFGLALRWYHVPVWLLLVSLVGFVRVYLRAGRLWLAWAVWVVRTLSLLLNFVLTPNLNYRWIAALRQVAFLGERVSVADGVPNPWMVVGNASLLLLVIFVTDAAASVWRRGNRRQAIVVGGSIVLFAVAGTAQAVLALWGVVHTPLTASLFYLGLVAVMGYELSQDVLRASDLARDLRESEERLRLVVEASPSGIVLVNGEGRMGLVNSETERLFGYTRGELIGLGVDMLVPERFRGAHPGHRAEFLAAPRTRVMGAGPELFGRRKDGTEFPVEIGLSPIQGADGVLMLMAIVDITARKLAEADAVWQRNALAHASRLTVVGELTASIAHEINQPLGAILSYAEAAEILTADMPGLDQVRQILAEIRHEDLRASDVIQHVRALANKGIPEMLPVDVNDVVQDARHLMHHDAARRGIELTTEISADRLAVTGVRVQLQQVVLNLILNGMEAMAETTKLRRVVVRTARTEGEVQVAVVDAGPGIDPADLPRLFESFFTTKKEGMGLGLSIARSIVEAHGGRIWAENSPTGGATFRIALPAAASENPPRAV